VEHQRTSSSPDSSAALADSSSGSRLPDVDAMADEVEAPGRRRLGPLMAAAAAAARL